MVNLHGKPLFGEDDLFFSNNRTSKSKISNNPPMSLWHPIWSNYSDLTRPHSKWCFSKGHPLIAGKSRSVKYWLARTHIPWIPTMKLRSYPSRRPSGSFLACFPTTFVFFTKTKNRSGYRWWHHIHGSYWLWIYPLPAGADDKTCCRPRSFQQIWLDKGEATTKKRS